MSAEKTLYEVLGLKENAETEEVRRAFRHAAKEHHPDRSSEQEPPAFRAACEAYETLKDPGLRSAYDSELARQRRRDDVFIRRSNPARPNRAVREAQRMARAAFEGNPRATLGGAFATVFAALDEMRLTWNETRLGFTDALLGNEAAGVDFDLEMSPQEAEAGAPIRVPTKHGYVQVHIPAGVRHGDILEVGSSPGAPRGYGVRLRVVFTS